MIKIEKIFIWWSLVAVALTYSGLIIGGNSDKKVWKYFAKIGQVTGAVGLFAILLYLAVE